MKRGESEDTRLRVKLMAIASVRTAMKARQGRSECLGVDRRLLSDRSNRKIEISPGNACCEQLLQ